MKVINKFFVIVLLLSLILTIGAVAAEDNRTLKQSNINMVSIEDLNDDKLSDMESGRGNVDKLSQCSNEEEVVINSAFYISGSIFSDIQKVVDNGGNKDTNDKLTIISSNSILNRDTKLGVFIIESKSKFSSINNISNPSKPTLNLKIENKSHSAVTDDNDVGVLKINTNNSQVNDYNNGVPLGNSKDHTASNHESNSPIITKIENKKKINEKIIYQVYRPKAKSKVVEYNIKYWKNNGTHLIPDSKNSLSGFKKIKYYKNDWVNVSKKKFYSDKYKWLKKRYYTLKEWTVTKILYKNVNGKKVVIQKIKEPVFKKSKNKYVRKYDWSKYVLPSIDCESDNNKIKKISKQIIDTEEKKLKKKYKKKNIKLTDEQKANAILHWVQKKINYEKYANTRRGALKTLNDKKGNCADSTHLTVALLRAANIPAKYEAKSVYLQGGHIWPLAYFNGKWWVGESTHDHIDDFGKCVSIIKKWVKKPAKNGTYVNSHKYSQKYVQYGPDKEWYAITEIHLIDGQWLSYYVIRGNAVL